MIYVLGALVFGTYVGLLSFAFEWSACAWSWCVRALVSLWAFFRLTEAGFPDWLWLSFLICALGWVPCMFADETCKTRVSVLTVWTASSSALLVQSVDRGPWTTFAAAWFWVQHVGTLCKSVRRVARVY